MSKTVKLLALLLLAGGMLAGCNKVNISRGGKIVFTVSSESVSTRTSYSGVEGTDTDGKKERIDWVAGDKFTIWSDKARNTDNQPVADYEVGTITTNGLISHATVASVDANGLQWGTGTHTFYARYPNDATKIDGDYMSGSIPGTQTLLYDAESGRISPDMQYAFMLAKTTATPDDETVTLKFYPEFTALQFEVGGGGNGQVDLTSFQVTSSSDPVTGGFQVVCSTGVASGTGTPGLSASMDFSRLPGGKLTVTGDAPVKVTVLAVPMALKNLTVTINGDAIGTRTLKLSDKNGNMLTFPGGKKYRITGLNLPELLNVTGENIDWDIEALLEPMIWD